VGSSRPPRTSATVVRLAAFEHDVVHDAERRLVRGVEKRSALVVRRRAARAAGIGLRSIGCAGRIRIDDARAHLLYGEWLRKSASVEAGVRSSAARAVQAMRTGALRTAPRTTLASAGSRPADERAAPAQGADP
jgi:hypothetical protein